MPHTFEETPRVTRARQELAAALRDQDEARLLQQELYKLLGHDPANRPSEDSTRKAKIIERLAHVFVHGDGCDD